MSASYGGRLFVLVTFIVAAAAFAACRVRRHDKANQMSMNITGTWRKTGRGSCSEKYPERITFAANGIYTAVAAENAVYLPVWDAGTFELVREGAIRISTSTDAYIIYSVTLTGRLLQFKDPEGCIIRYMPATK